MAKPSAGGPSIQAIGLIAAGAVAVAIAGVFIFLSSTASPTTPQETEGPGPETVPLGLGGESGSQMRIQLADRDDPTKLIGEITAERFEPIDEVNRRVDQPRAWIYLDQGRVAHIEAQTGRFLIPAGQTQPTSGVLEGDVRIRLYEPRADGSRPEPGVDTAALTATFDEPVNFDLDLARVLSSGRVEVTSEQIDFVGSDVWVVFNETRERLEQLQVARGEIIRYRPLEEAPETEATPATERPAPAADVAAAPAPSSPAPPKEDRYKIVFEESVEVRQDQALIEADRLDAWVRLLDNAIPQRAAAPPRTPTAEHVLAAALSSMVLMQDSATEPAAPMSLGLGAADGPVEITWTGPLTVEALDSDPAQLTTDDIHLLFTAGTSGVVTFRDDASEASGTAAELAYADRRGTILLTGRGGAVELAGNDTGRLSGANRVEIDSRTGLVTVAGPGGLYGPGDNPAEPLEREYVEWRDGASFVFATEDGSMTDSIERATLRGLVSGRSGDARVSGSAMDAMFLSTTEGEPRLAMIDIADASATDGPGAASLDAASLRVDFDPTTEGDPEPVRLVAGGSVVARDGAGGELRSDALSADLARNSEDELDVTFVVATAEGETPVRFTDGSGVSGVTRSLEARPAYEQATLSGDGTRVELDDSVLTGSRIDVDGLTGSVATAGAGAFRHVTNDADGNESILSAGWTRSMSYDGRRGELICEGEVSASSDTPGLQRDTLTASRLIANLERDGEPATGSTATRFDAGSTIRTASLIGTEDQRATVESRRFGEREGAPAVTQLFYLESARIDLDAGADQATTPAPGRLLLLDRADASRAPSEGDPRVGPGQTLFDWQGSMQMDRAAGAVAFERSVVVRHLDFRTGDLTEAEAEHLDAAFDLAPQADGDAAIADGQLRSINAVGAVWLKQGGQELLADDVSYDADAGIAVARSSEDGAVALFDPERAAVLRGRVLEWDLVTGRIQVIRPVGAPAAAPGN